MRIMKVLMVTCLLGITTAKAEVQPISQDVAFANMPVLKGLMDLKVTRDQKHELAKILKSYKPEVEDALNGVVAARKSLFEIIHAPAFDEAAIRGAARSVATNEEELAVLRGEIVHDLRAVLTPEQQAKMVEVRHDLTTRIQSAVDLVRALVDGWVNANT